MAVSAMEKKPDKASSVTRIVSWAERGMLFKGRGVGDFRPVLRPGLCLSSRAGEQDFRHETAAHVGEHQGNEAG